MHENGPMTKSYVPAYLSSQNVLCQHYIFRSIPVQHLKTSEGHQGQSLSLPSSPVLAPWSSGEREPKGMVYRERWYLDYRASYVRILEPMRTPRDPT